MSQAASLGDSPYLPNMDPEDLFFDPFGKVDVRTRNMPHWRQDGKLYFVTWRQADSIPKLKREQIIHERKAFLLAHGDPFSEDMSELQRRRYYQLFDARVQRWLDAGAGSCLLKHPEAQRIVRDALYHFDNSRYQLGSFAIAANHVHVLVACNKGHQLSDVLHSWKSFTANAINKALRRSGTLWQDESHDHLVRHEIGLARITAYIHAHEEQGAFVEKRRLI